MTKLWSVGTLLVGIGLGVACGDGTEPITPEAIAKVDGDGQSGPLNVALPVPLRVAVTGSNSAAFVGGTVTWEVTQGSATVNPTSGPTDANGQAQTTLTVGGVQGSVTVTATIAALPPATFGVTAVHPCDWFVPHTLGTSVEGLLTAFDCGIPAGGGGVFRTDFYEVTLTTQEGVSATMNAGFDAWLETYFINLAFLAFNDDADGSTSNASIPLIAAPGTYLLAPSSFAANVTGAYTLTTAVQPQTLTGCPASVEHLPWITRGIAITDAVTLSDCAEPDTAPNTGTFYSDRVLIYLDAGQSLTATLASTEFDAFLALVEVSVETPAVVASDDNTAGGTDALLSYTTPNDAIFVLDVGTADTAEVGAYTLTIGGAPGGGPPVQLLPPQSSAWRSLARRVELLPKGLRRARR